MQPYGTIMINGIEYILVSVERWKDVNCREDWLSCLEAAGVDNWPGIDYAHELRGELDETNG